MIATFLITFLFKDRQITQVTPTLKSYTEITSETSVSTYKPKGFQNPVKKFVLEEWKRIEKMCLDLF